MEVLRPFPAFYFRVTLAGAADGADTGFAEATGLEAEREVDLVAEGGENRFAHRLPGRVRHRNVVLRRGLLPAESPLRSWCVRAIQSDLGQKFKPKQVDVELLDPEGSPVVTWSLARAWPVRMAMGAFDATTNAAAVEVLEISFANIFRRDGAAAGVSLGFG
jgi:phage tail-like protein